MTNLILNTRLIYQDTPEKYFLHVVTYMHQTDYRCDGHDIPQELDAEGLLNIKLYLKEDPTLPDFCLETPVVHTLTLGTLPFGSTGGTIKINVEDRQGSKIGDTIITTADADEVARPLLPSD